MPKQVWPLFAIISGLQWIESKKSSAFVLLPLLASQAAFSQALPQITGVVNAASYAQPIAPGAIVTIFGTNLATTVAIASGATLPTDLAGTSVTVVGKPGMSGPFKAPLFFVSPSQINLQVPWSVGFMTSDYVGSVLTVTTPAGTSNFLEGVTLYESSPSLFSADSSGCGQAAALNIRPDGTVSLNTPSNSAETGDYVSLYGTGFGIPPNPPADGTATGGPDSFLVAPEVDLDANPVPMLSYAGMAPSLVGVGQINFQIPPGTREGCAIPVAVKTAGLLSPTLSIAVHSGRGQCVDPPTQSYGLVTLTKAVTSGMTGTTDSESVTATFPFAPGLQFPQAPAPSPSYFVVPTPPLEMTRACPLNGTGQSSAGTLSVEAPGSPQAITAQPVSAVGGVAYQETLPNGFITPAQYTIAASGPPVAFQGALTIPASIQIQTPLAPGTKISVTQPFTVNWTGGIKGTTVKITVIAGGYHQLVSPSSVIAYADASSGTYTFTCTSDTGANCPFVFLPGSFAGTVIIEVSPASGYARVVNASGATKGVYLSWTYRYEFDNLVLNP